MSNDNYFLFASQSCGITKDRLLLIAAQSGFRKRVSGKIDPLIFFSALVRGICKRNCQS